MSAITILLFFIYTYGLGFTISKLVKSSDSFLEKNIMRIGIGLATLPLLGVLLDLINIPLDWKIFLVLSLAYPLYYLFSNIKSNKPNLKLKIRKSDIYVLIVIVFFIFTLFMYTKGAFSYPYLEDDDPWSHAVSTKYVSIEKSLKDPNQDFKYLNPYPPAYNLVMGILHQTSPSLMWTLKFFNALIISLGVLFFYFFVKRFSENNNVALASAFVLTMIPCYLSHFIWAHSLAVTLIFPALYCLERIKNDSKWKYISAIVISGILLTQPTQAIKFGVLFLIYLVIKSIIQKKFLTNTFIAGFGGLLLSITWWYNKWRGMFTAGQVGEVAEPISTSFISELIVSLKKAFPYDGGTATRVYNFNDFIIAKSQNMINNPVGVGKILFSLLIICLAVLLINFLITVMKNKKNLQPAIYYFLNFLAVIGSINLLLFIFKSLIALVYLLITLIIIGLVLINKNLIEKQKYAWVMVALTWLLFAYLGINSMTFKLPFGLFAFRFWMLFAIPASILIGFMINTLAKYIKSIEKQFNIKYLLTGILLIILVFGIWKTSGIQKYTVNTAMWGPGQSWTSMEEVQGYVWLKTLPVNTKVYDFRGDGFIMGFDKYSCAWCEGIKEYRNRFAYENATDIHKWLKKHKYPYAIIGGMSIQLSEERYGEEGPELVQEKIEELAKSNLFAIVHQTKGMMVLKVK